MSAIVVLSLFWLLGTGLVTPMLFSRRRRQQEQDIQPTRFDHLRATSTYRAAMPTAAPRQIVFRTSTG